MAGPTIRHRRRIPGVRFRLFLARLHSNDLGGQLVHVAGIVGLLARDGMGMGSWYTVPVPDTAGLSDLWLRASRVRECCDIMVDVTAHPPGWHVIVRSRGKPPETVDGTGEHLIEAMDAAFDRAEARGFIPSVP